jgi:Meiotically Up-regulated Gene 113 (MUG113) protein
MAVSKESILSAYSDLVKANVGRPVGERIFTRETGISRYYWQGGHWRSWSAFQADAGHTPNRPTQKIPDETVLKAFVQLAVEQGNIPSEADLMLKRKADPSFPNKLCFRRWGDRPALLAKVTEYCSGREDLAPVLELLHGSSIGLDHRLEASRIKGFVYLLRSGKHYKLGRSNAVGRRLRELAIQLPEKPNTVHVIETDDPQGIEQYWHTRFEQRRKGGEWFELTPEDVGAFKKRRFQ